MKMAKVTEPDIDAAGDAMSVLQNVSSGHYPDKSEEDGPYFFDPDDFDHLRHFYDLMKSTLDKSPGWPGRVIGGMCFVIMFDENKIVDPNSDALDIHPQYAAAPELLQALTDLRDAIEAGQEPALGDANRAIRKANGGAA